jgi:hypothetical protein
MRVYVFQMSVPVIFSFDLLSTKRASQKLGGMNGVTVPF